MESAELKSNKRVRHCYPRSEVYHRWVHDETLVYHSKSLPVWGKYNWLFVNPYPARKATKEDIIEAWGYHREHCVAVIDRDKKRVLINVSYRRKHWWDIKNAIPNDYEVFLTDKNIPTANILSDDERLFKLHITYVLAKFTNVYLGTFYNTLAGRVKFPYHAYEHTFDYRDYKDIVDFARKHNLKQYSWYKISLGETKVCSSNKEWWKFETYPIPSINKVVRRKLFTKKEILLLEQKYFYRKYCYNNGIPFKDVVENWNKHILEDEAIAYLRAHNNYCVFNNAVSDNTWNEYIKVAVEAERIYLQNKEKENIDKSQQNYLNALAERDKLVNEVYTVNDWREGKRIPSTAGRGVPYRRYVPYSKRTGPAHWTDDVVPFNFNSSFPNVQLRLTKDGKRIETSKDAVVSLEDGIKLYKLFILTTRRADSKNCYFDFTNKNIKVGIYNLRVIKHAIKYSDNSSLNNLQPVLVKYNTEWVIQVGCHNIWLDDIEDFIRYYHLEDKFHSNTTKKNNN